MSLATRAAIRRRILDGVLTIAEDADLTDPHEADIPANGALGLATLYIEAGAAMTVTVRLSPLLSTADEWYDFDEVVFAAGGTATLNLSGNVYRSIQVESTAADDSTVRLLGAF
jgi:hypothetical protein